MFGVAARLGPSRCHSLRTGMRWCSAGGNKSGGNNGERISRALSNAEGGGSSSNNNNRNRGGFASRVLDNNQSSGMRQDRGGFGNRNNYNRRKHGNNQNNNGNNNYNNNNNNRRNNFNNQNNDRNKFNNNRRNDCNNQNNEGNNNFNRRNNFNNQNNDGNNHNNNRRNNYENRNNFQNNDNNNRRNWRNNNNNNRGNNQQGDQVRTQDNMGGNRNFNNQVQRNDFNQRRGNNYNKNNNSNYNDRSRSGYNQKVDPRKAGASAAQTDADAEPEPYVDDVDHDDEIDDEVLLGKDQEKNATAQKFAKKKKFRSYDGDSEGFSKKDGNNKHQNNNNNNNNYKGSGNKKEKHQGAKPKQPVRKVKVKVKVKVSDSMTVRDLSLRSGIKSLDIINKMIALGEFQSDGGDQAQGVKMKKPISKYLLAQLKLEATSGTGRIVSHQVSSAAESLTVSADVSELVLEEFGLECEREDEVSVDEVPTDTEMAMLQDNGKLTPRPPVVTIMGHVDHGKTTLLDHLRNTAVAAGEAGGITQAVAAFTVKLGDNDIVFCDTPGHEAFASMRKCGSQLTDIIVLVIAATDGVRPQTVESIKLAQAAGVPMIIALSKIDMPGIKKDDAMMRISNQLAEHDVLTDVVGGTVQMIPIAAPSNLGLTELAEAITFQAELMELKADAKARGEAVVMEARTTVGLGGVIDIIMRWGSLRVGDVIVCGEQTTKIRQLLDPVSNKPMKIVGPSLPAKLTGFSDPPKPGSYVLAVPNAKRAKEVVDFRVRRRKATEESEMMKMLQEQEKKDLEAKAAEAGEATDGEEQGVGEVEAKPINLNAIIKGDTDGSLEALHYSIESVSDTLKMDTGFDESGINVIRRSVGPVTESDVSYAKSSGATIFAFNVRVPPAVMKAAKQGGVNIYSQNVIYHLLDDMKKIVEEHKPKATETVVRGKAKVLQIFEMSPRTRSEGTWIVAGCVVESGTVAKKYRLRVVRDGEVIHKSGLDSLKRFKESVNEVSNGMECGISLSTFQEFKVGDIIEAYEEVAPE